MKKLSLFIILLLIATNFVSNFAQSRPQTGTGNTKINQRPTPTPQTETVATNSEKVEGVDDDIIKVRTVSF